MKTVKATTTPNDKLRYCPAYLAGKKKIGLRRISVIQVWWISLRNLPPKSAKGKRSYTARSVRNLITTQMSASRIQQTKNILRDKKSPETCRKDQQTREVRA